MSGDTSPAFAPFKAAKVSGLALDMKFWNDLQSDTRKNGKSKQIDNQD
jgi:hypothetical protein